MGVVLMEISREYKYKFQGVYVYEETHCLYCDKCGSFDIGKQLTYWMLIGGLVPSLITYVFWTRMKEDILATALPIILPCCFGLILWLVSLTGIFQYGHRCKKFGNREMTMSNSLNYKEYDRSLLDVPLSATIKYYKDSY